jgi:hypothetical protein
MLGRSCPSYDAAWSPVSRGQGTICLAVRVHPRTQRGHQLVVSCYMAVGCGQFSIEHHYALIGHKTSKIELVKVTHIQKQ